MVYEAVFVSTAKIGLMSSNLPNDEIIELITKKNLERLTEESL